MHHRRSFLAAGCAGAATWLVRPALAQAWPSRPLRLVVPYPPGGAVDLAGRLIADALRERLGQPVVVENRGGAGGNIGVAAVAKSAPDGYTLAATAVNSLAINQFMYDRLPFDPERDLVPVSLGWEAPLVLVVPAGHVPARTVEEFVAWAKGQPSGVTYGSSSIGTTVHLSAALFCRRTGIDGTHVPFRGGSEALTALLRGDTRFAVDNLPTVIAAVRDGALRALAVTSAERWPDLPDVPTMAEAGVPDLVVTSWGADLGAGRHAAPDHREAVGGDPRRGGRSGGAGALRADRQPPAGLDARGGGGARRPGAADVARGGPHLRRETRLMPTAGDWLRGGR